MAEIIYYGCTVNNEHPKKGLARGSLLRPYCCGKPMVRVPIDADQTIAKPQASTQKSTESKSTPVNQTQPQLKK